jgi:tetratricopeptide (TPR) repeat protein
MRPTPLLLVLVLFSVLGITAARADDTELCYSSSSDDWKRESYFETALKACSRLISSTSGNVQAAAYRARGYWKMRMGNLRPALEDLNTAVRKEPNNIEGYNYRADIYVKMDELDRALADYNMATRIDPTFPAAYFNRGYVYEKKGDKASAREEYLAALAVPAKNRLGEWAHEQARERLSFIGQ